MRRRCCNIGGGVRRNGAWRIPGLSAIPSRNTRCPRGITSSHQGVFRSRFLGFEASLGWRCVVVTSSEGLCSVGGGGLQHRQEQQPHLYRLPLFRLPDMGVLTCQGLVLCTLGSVVSGSVLVNADGKDMGLSRALRRYSRRCHAVARLYAEAVRWRRTLVVRSRGMGLQWRYMWPASPQC